jgi:hypothetical protein
MVTDSWALDSSRGDRAKVEEARWPLWTPDAWAFMSLHKPSGSSDPSPSAGFIGELSRRSKKLATPAPCPASRSPERSA